MEKKKTMRSFKEGIHAEKAGVGAALGRPCALLLAAVLLLMPMLLMDRALAAEVPRTCQTYILSIQKLEFVLEDGDSFSMSPDAGASATLTPEGSTTLSFTSSAADGSSYFTQTYTLTFEPMSDHEWSCDSSVVYTGVLFGDAIPSGTEYETSESLVLDSGSIGSSARVRVAYGNGDGILDGVFVPGVCSAVFSVGDGGLAEVNSEPQSQEPDMDGFFPDDFDSYDGFEDIDGFEDYDGFDDYDDYYDVEEEGASPIVKIAAAAGGLAVLGGIVAAIVKAMSAKAAAAAAANTAAQTAKAASAASEAASEAAAQRAEPPERQTAPAKAAPPDIPLGAADYLGGPGDNPYTSFENATTCKLS